MLVNLPALLALAAWASVSAEASFVPGSAFDRFVIIYFENQNYEKAIGDRKSLFSPFDAPPNSLQPTLVPSQSRVSVSQTTTARPTRPNLTTCRALLGTILA